LGGRCPQASHSKVERAAARGDVVTPAGYVTGTTKSVIPFRRCYRRCAAVATAAGRRVPAGRPG
jgi:hypothetical protein